MDYFNYIKYIVLRQWRITRKWYKRFMAHFQPSLLFTKRFLGVVSFIASLMCLVCMIIYVGFDHSIEETHLISKILRGGQIVFLVYVLYNFTFDLRGTLRDTRIARWIADGGIILSAYPLLFPSPAHPWFPIVERILYSNRYLFPVLAFYSILTVSYGIVRIMGKRTNPSLILSSSFLLLIIAGSFLLMMPRCTIHGLSYVDSLFVSTSAVCITGLCPVDIATTFTPFGIFVIGVLIQIGGLGVMTFTSFFALFFSGNTSIYSQLMVKDMIYTKSINSLLPSLLYILGFTLTIEAIGAVGMFFSIHGLTEMSFSEELAFSAFHSLSAFCNAGFSNIEGGLSNPAFLYSSSQGIYVVASILIFLGGVGFPILVNFKEAFFRYFRRILNFLTRTNSNREPVHLYDMNTKIVLFTTIVIMLVSSLLFFIFEYSNSLAQLTLYEKIIQSVFNSFVPRSSGFASLNPAGFLNITLLMMIVLMCIGGASQSTAGGIKVNAFAAILLNIRAIITGRQRVTAYGRTVSPGSIKWANAVVCVSIMSYILYSAILIAFETELSPKALLYESASALFTVGSSLGVTPSLSTSSKILLSTAMFLGRVGILSLLTGFFSGSGEREAVYPTDHIIIN